MPDTVPTALHTLPYSVLRDSLMDVVLSSVLQQWENSRLREVKAFPQGPEHVRLCGRPLSCWGPSAHPPTARQPWPLPPPSASLCTLTASLPWVRGSQIKQPATSLKSPLDWDPYVLGLASACGARGRGRGRWEIAVKLWTKAPFDFSLSPQRRGQRLALTFSRVFSYLTFLSVL